MNATFMMYTTYLETSTVRLKNSLLGRLLGYNRVEKQEQIINNG